jgi:hypothetical protein
MGTWDVRPIELAAELSLNKERRKLKNRGFEPVESTELKSGAAFGVAFDSVLEGTAAANAGTIVSIYGTAKVVPFPSPSRSAFFRNLR